MNTSEIVSKLWSLCHILRDDGVTYNEYVTELTFLLFLKMLEETKKEDRLPKAYRWRELAKRDGLDQLDYYKRLLLDLGKPAIKDALVQAIFIDAQTRLRKPTNLKSLTASIDQLDWFSAREEGLGTLYEGLLQKNAEEIRRGAVFHSTTLDRLCRLSSRSFSNGTARLLVPNWCRTRIASA
jgi:type I restriction enzyme M protein